MNTIEEYNDIINTCRTIFQKKMHDYGTAWRILRLPSITDQIYIKAQRIRSIQEKGEMYVNEGVENEFIGIVNYCTMALIQLNEGAVCPTEEYELKEDITLNLYNH